MPSSQAHLCARHQSRNGRQAGLVHGNRARGARPGDRHLDAFVAARHAAAKEAGLLPLDRIPGRQGPDRHAGQSWPASAGARRAGLVRRRSRRLAELRARSGPRQWRPRPACRLLSRQHVGAGDPRLRLRHPLPAWPVRAALPRRLAGGVSRPVAGAWKSVGISAPGNDLSGSLRRHGRIHGRRQGNRAGDVVSVRDGACDSLRCRFCRMARPSRQHAQALVRAPDAAEPAWTAWRSLPQRHRRAHAARGDLGRALSERQHARGSGAAAPPGVFLHIGVPAGPGAAPSVRARHAGYTAGLRGDPVERHAPGDRRRRADADPGRRERFLMEAGLDHHPLDAELHQPHPAPRGARKLAGLAARPASAAAPADHLPDQLAAPAIRGRARLHRTRFHLPHLADRRERGPPRPHGASRLRRLPLRQRRLGAAHRASAPDRVRRSRQGLADADRQQDQRHQLPPLAVRGQRRADGAAARGARRPRAGQSGKSRAARKEIVRRGIHRPLRRHAGAEQGAARGPASPPDRRRGRADRAVRRSHQAHP